ncbi:MAG: TonB-dependent receptor [Caulobacteraceae bacterium]|nr:TonB-dependent receptor [Caulobacteraceae bacterium]
MGFGAVPAYNWRKLLPRRSGSRVRQHQARQRLWNYTNPHDTTTLDAYALFGQAEDFTDRLTLVLGARYNEEHRDYTVDYTQAPVPGIVTSGSITDSIVIPSLGLTSS